MCSLTSCCNRSEEWTSFIAFFKASILFIGLFKKLGEYLLKYQKQKLLLKQAIEKASLDFIPDSPAENNWWGYKSNSDHAFTNPPAAPLLSASIDIPTIFHFRYLTLTSISDHALKSRAIFDNPAYSQPIQRSIKDIIT